MPGQTHSATKRTAEDFRLENAQWDTLHHYWLSILERGYSIKRMTLQALISHEGALIFLCNEIQKTNYVQSSHVHMFKHTFPSSGWTCSNAVVIPSPAALMHQVRRPQLTVVARRRGGEYRRGNGGTRSGRRTPAAFRLPTGIWLPSSSPTRHIKCRRCPNKKCCLVSWSSCSTAWSELIGCWGAVVYVRMGHPDEVSPDSETCDKLGKSTASCHILQAQHLQKLWKETCHQNQEQNIISNHKLSHFMGHQVECSLLSSSGWGFFVPAKTSW